jgi:transcriptional regulator with XRE-family HTH domain
MIRLGERIRRKREMLNMPLSELSKKVGISISALSQIENAKAFPSVLTLKTIAVSLFTTVGDLIGENETLTNNPLIKADNVKFVKVNNSGTSQYLLSHHDNSKQMEPYLMTFIKNSDSEEIMIEHPGQEFIYILEGKLMMTIGEIKYILEKNDSLYYNSSIAHSIKNIGDGSARIIWIITPPNI